MYCPKCGKEIPKGASSCPECGGQAPKTKSDASGLAIAAFVLSIIGFLTGFLFIGLVLDVVSIILAICVLVKSKGKLPKPALATASIVIALVSIVLCLLIYNGVENAVVGETTSTSPSSRKTTTENENGSDGTAEEERENETGTVNEPIAENAENTYDHNEYYDIVESVSYKNSIGYTIIIDKVLAKKNASASGTLLAYDPAGNVIGKSSDDITLTEGQYNFFRYSFESDISEASIQESAKTQEDSFMTGPRNAVEMVQYNQSGDDLYITFRQVTDEIGVFAKFKLLFYKDGTIVDTEDGYFSIYAENLNGKDSTDVAKIWVYGVDYDRMEYIFEP